MKLSLGIVAKGIKKMHDPRFENGLKERRKKKLVIFGNRNGSIFFYPMLKALTDVKLSGQSRRGAN